MFWGCCFFFFLPVLGKREPPARPPTGLGSAGRLWVPECGQFLSDVPWEPWFFSPLLVPAVRLTKDRRCVASGSDAKRDPSRHKFRFEGALQQLLNIHKTSKQDKLRAVLDYLSFPIALGRCIPTERRKWLWVLVATQWLLNSTAGDVSPWHTFTGANKTRRNKGVQVVGVVCL